MRSIRRSTKIAAAAASFALLLTACGTDDGADTGATDDTTTTDDTMTDDGMTDDGMTEDGTDEESMEGDAAALPTGEFGEGCAAIPEDGPGSSEGMAQDPAATAASNNPALSTLVSLVDQAGLVDALNGLEGATIFAPSNDAFEALQNDDPETFEAVAGDNDLLTEVLTYHVVADEELDAQGLADAGTVTSLNGQDLSVSAEGETVTVDAAGSDATVVCGNVATANATVHIIDYVLVPDVG